MANANNQYPIQPVNLSLTDSSGDNTEQSAINQWIENQNGVINSFDFSNTVNGQTPVWKESNTVILNERGPVTRGFVVNASSGYDSAPTFTILDGGTGAEIQAPTRNHSGNFHGEMANTIIVNGGSGYTSNATITFPAPDQTVGGAERQVQATGTLVINDEGEITDVTFTNRGAGYNPSFNNGRFYTTTITDPGTGTGATGTANVEPGTITSLTRTADVDPNYSEVPDITFVGGGGSGANAVAIVEDGYPVRVDLIDGGTGYTSRPDVVFSGGNGNGLHPTFVANMRFNGLNEVNITNGGSNYSNPRAVFDDDLHGANTHAEVVLEYDFETSNTAVNQFIGGTTGDELKLFQRFVPSQTENPEIYSADINDESVAEYTSVNLDYAVSNKYIVGMIQRTNSLTVTTTPTGRILADGTAEVQSSITNFSFSFTINFDAAFQQREIDFRELRRTDTTSSLGDLKASLEDNNQIISRLATEQLSETLGDSYGVSSIGGVTLGELDYSTGTVSISISGAAITTSTSTTTRSEGGGNRGESDPLGTRDGQEGRPSSPGPGSGTPSSPAGPRPGSEPPSRGGPSGQGQEHSSPVPSRQGVRGAQATSRTIQSPLQYLIERPSNMLPGQSMDIYFVHDYTGINSDVAPRFSLDFGISANDISALRSNGGLRDARGLYSVNNEVVGVRLNKLQNEGYTITKLGIWPIPTN